VSENRMLNKMSGLRTEEAKVNWGRKGNVEFLERFSSLQRIY
jgi:hypothetical protein